MGQTAFYDFIGLFQVLWVGAFYQGNGAAKGGLITLQDAVDELCCRRLLFPQLLDMLNGCAAEAVRLADPFFFMKGCFMGFGFIHSIGL